MQNIEKLNYFFINQSNTFFLMVYKNQFKFICVTECLAFKVLSTFEKLVLII